MKKLTTFGLEVKRALLDRQMTQKQFCTKHNIPENRFSEILYGSKPGNKYRAKIAQALGIDSEYLAS
ncbi:MAG: Rha family transcriptional regulator [Firmicutes bacterium]|nr:Rha family transcriptional regulator [Bacillota bacterium]